MKIKFLGTPEFIKPVKQALESNFTLVEDINLAELLIVSAYGKILSEDFINTPKYGALNIHPSLLPKYRGASPIQAAILNGEKETGVTIMKMDSKIDHGPIIAQQRLAIKPNDTFESLAQRSFKLGAEMLIKLIPEYVKGEIEPVEQDHNKATFCKIIKKEDGYFDINTPPEIEKLSRMVRAYYPWPGVWTRWNNKIVKLLPKDLVQMEGKKPVPLNDFLNGYPSWPIKQSLEPQA